MVGLRPMSLEEIGCFMGYYGEGESIVFCLDPERFPQIDFDLDRVKVAGSFNNWGGRATVLERIIFESTVRAVVEFVYFQSTN